MNYELRIDIEQVDPNSDCARPISDVLLCESDDPGIIEKQFSRLQSLFPFTDRDGVNDRGVAVTAIIYTVFVSKNDEVDSVNYYEEWDIAAFTNLKKAKKLMKEITGLMIKGEK